MSGLKIIINALLKSMRQLGDAILLSLFCMMVLALFGLQVYRGDLRNKCVLEAPPAVVWSDWVSNPQNWLTVDEDPRLCGNVTGARSDIEHQILAYFLCITSSSTEL